MIPPTSAQQTIADGVYVGATLISEGLAGGEQARPGGGGPGGGQPGLKSLRYCYPAGRRCAQLAAN